MREIKKIAIRVWDKQCNKWASVRNLVLSRCGDEKFYNMHLDEYERFTIQRYVGVRDKNGQNIYEGDLVDFQYETGPGEWDGARPEGEEVFFEEGIFYFGRELKFATNDCNFDKKSLEVVGNIFDGVNKA